MKSKVGILLLFSFVVNIALVAGFWMNRSAPQATVKDQSPAEPAARVSKVARSQRPGQTITVTRDKALDWTTVESADYIAYIENLRAIGCPEETVRDIIIADINKLYASKIAALYPSPKEFKFWRVEDRAARSEDRERDHKRHELEDEKRELIRELLGIDYESEMARWSGRPNEDDFRYGFLSPEKQEGAKALYQKYRDMERELFRDGGGWTAENRAKFTAMRAEREAELAKLLGPEEFQEYQLRNSYTARNMRDNLSAFQPNESEFRQIFDLKKAFDDQFAFTRESSDETIREQRRLAQEQLNQQLLAKLGPERFQQYERSQDERYRDANDFVQRNNLPQETANVVYEVRIAAEQERERIRNDASLNEEARNSAYAALSQTTGQALGQALGAEVYANYQTRNDWVRELDRTRERNRDRDRDRRRR
jgi:hypothetical protein